METRDYLDDVTDARAASDPIYAAMRAKDDVMDRLIGRRETLALTQQQIADAIGIRRERVAELERNTHKASFERIYAYARALGVEIQLVEVDPSGPINPASHRQVAENRRGFNVA